MHVAQKMKKWTILQRSPHVFIIELEKLVDNYRIVIIDQLPITILFVTMIGYAYASSVSYILRIGSHSIRWS